MNRFSKLKEWKVPTQGSNNLKRPGTIPLGQEIPLVKNNTPSLAKKSPLTQGAISKTITFRCDTHLLERINSALISQRLAGNYQWASLSNIVRKALLSYQQGLSLTYQRQNNPKRRICCVLDPELTQFYLNLPLRQRTEILERALGSYLDQQLLGV